MTGKASLSRLVDENKRLRAALKEAGEALGQCQRVLHNLTRVPESAPNGLTSATLFAQSVEAATRARTTLSTIRELTDD